MSNGAPIVDVSATINEQRLGRTQAIVITISAFIALLDGLDLQMIGMAAPSIAIELAISPGSLGVVFSAALAGLGIGAFVVGPLADRLGRKTSTRRRDTPHGGRQGPRQPVDPALPRTCGRPLRRPARPSDRWTSGTAVLIALGDNDPRLRTWVRRPRAWRSRRVLGRGFTTV
jgi:hypothetical protein